MPAWVKEVIRNASPRRTEDYNDLRKEFQELLNKYKVKVMGRHVDPAEGKSSAAERKGQELATETGAGGAGGDSGTRNSRRRFQETPEGAIT